MSNGSITKVLPEVFLSSVIRHKSKTLEGRAETSENFTYEAYKIDFGRRIDPDFFHPM